MEVNHCLLQLKSMYHITGNYLETMEIQHVIVFIIINMFFFSPCSFLFALICYYSTSMLQPERDGK